MITINKKNELITIKGNENVCISFDSNFKLWYYIHTEEVINFLCYLIKEDIKDFIISKDSRSELKDFIIRNENKYIKKLQKEFPEEFN